MNSKLVLNKISKDDFLKINENDVMFITNPGRMGDEDGTTFIIKKDNDFIAYRINGWMYPSEEFDASKDISLDDVLKQFPKWYETWQNNNDENYQGKYKYLYMGFGNGLEIDNRIYDIFKPYLDELVEEYLEDKDNKENLLYGAIYSVWVKAVINMINDKKNSRLIK